MSTYILFEELNLPSCSRREPPVLTLTLTLIQELNLPFLLTTGATLGLAPPSDSLMFMAGQESDEHHNTLFPFLMYPFVLGTYILGLWYHWFIPENYDYQLSSKRLQAQTVALNSAFTFLLYFLRFAATKLREPGCFTTLSVKVTK